MHSASSSILGTYLDARPHPGALLPLPKRAIEAQSEIRPVRHRTLRGRRSRGRSSKAVGSHPELGELRGDEGGGSSGRGYSRGYSDWGGGTVRHC